MAASSSGVMPAAETRRRSASRPPSALGPADGARRYLDRLYEIGALLAQFDGAEQTVPSVLGVVSRAFGLRRAVLIAQGPTGQQTVTWQDGDAHDAAVQHAVASARRFLGYFVGEGTHAGSPDREARTDTLVLPLARDPRRIFGVLHVEAVDPLGEEELAFLSATASQLAIAMDRYRTWREEIALRERSSFLAEASRQFAERRDAEATLATMARIVVPYLGDACLIDAPDAPDANGLSLRAAATADPAHEPALRAARARYVPCSDDALAGALRSGRAVRGSTCDPSAHEADEGTHAALLDALGATSWMLVPLVAHGRALGVVTLVSTGRTRRFDDADLGVAETLATTAALAIDTALRYEDARRAARQREDLVAIVSHDLRNPLSALLLNHKLLEDALPEGDPGARARHFAQGIRRSAERMDRLIRDLLDAAQIEAGGLAIVRQPCSVASLANEAMEMLRPLADGRSLRLEAVLGQPDARIDCDRERVLQVLSNLVGNAIKFTPSGRSITLYFDRRIDALDVEVVDTGRGIAAEQLPHLFDRYWRGEARGRTGVGLGLFIVKAIVEAHGGSIRVESEAGRGTSVRFTLPDVPRAPG